MLRWLAEHTYWSLEDAGFFVYPVLFVGIATHLLLASDRAWRGPKSGTPVRRRLVVATFGAFACLLLTLVGNVWNVIVMIGALADPTAAVFVHVLIGHWNLVYVGLACATIPAVVMIRIVLFELNVAQEAAQQGAATDKAAQ